VLPARFLVPYRLLLGMVCCVVWQVCCTAQGTVVSLNAMTQGRFRSDGMHNGGNYNTSTAYSAPFRYNSFFVFDLANWEGTVDSATLYLTLDMFTYADINPPVNPSLTFDVFDASTPVSALDATYGPGNAAGIAIHNELGSGNIYATKTATASNVGTVLAIPLSAQALADIQAGLTSTFAVGLRLQGPDTATHILRFGETIDMNDSAYQLVQLQFNLIPPPPDPEPEDEPTLAIPEPGNILAWLGLLLVLRRQGRGRRHTR
jgi:hypothetical protein